MDKDALDRELVEKCWQRIQGAIKDEDGALDDFEPVRRRSRQRIARWQELGGSGDAAGFTLAFAAADWRTEGGDGAAGTAV